MTQQLFEAWAEDRQLMFDAQAELWELGREKARAEADYQRIKYQKALEMTAEGHKATLIQTIIKGLPEVNEALFRRDCAVSDYESAKEALNVAKLDLRVVEAQVDREYRG